MPRAIVIDPDDNVATLIDAGKSGENIDLAGVVDQRELTLASDISFGHKLAIKPISQGSDILKYGQVIGRATHAIAPGEHVHVHNVEALRGRGDIKDGE